MKARVSPQLRLGVEICGYSRNRRCCGWPDDSHDKGRLSERVVHLRSGCIASGGHQVVRLRCCIAGKCSGHVQEFAYV